MSNEKDSKFVLRLEPDLKAELEKEAKEQNRSLNGQILQILKDRQKRITVSGTDLHTIITRTNNKRK